MGKKHFCFFETGETGNRTPNSGVKGSGANHYPRAPALRVKLSPWDIGRSHRVGKPTQDKSRPIIAKFSTYGARSRMYGARKQCQDVYVSEDLTRRRSHLLYLARVERKAGRFKHCWSHDGRILVRLHDARVRGVTTTGELDKLVNKTPIGHH